MIVLYDKLYASIENLLISQFIDKNKWKPKIVKTVATQNKGIDLLAKALLKHQIYINFRNSTFKNRKTFIQMK